LGAADKINIALPHLKNQEPGNKVAGLNISIEE
jgi:hypothetical protein